MRSKSYQRNFVRFWIVIAAYLDNIQVIIKNKYQLSVILIAKMTLSQQTATLFFQQFELEETKTRQLVDEALHGLDDGELFMEIRQQESLLYDDQRLKTANFTTDQGFGLRGILGEMTAYSHSGELSHDAIKRSMQTIATLERSGRGGKERLNINSRAPLYTGENPLETLSFEEKLKTIQEIEAYIRQKDNRVKQVTVSLSGSWQAVHILKRGGESAGDIRPLVRLNINIVCQKGDRMESGSAGAGGRVGYVDYLQPSKWKSLADEALRQALVNLESISAPAGEMPVVLGNGWPGVLLHEAVGHGLEGDFNRKGSSVFSTLMGEQVAAKGVTVVDDGTMQDRRGSINIDDEGSPSARNVLIEDGKLVGYMQDRLNARLMGVSLTGNGRREHYGCQPMPRMTNTFMLNGKHTRDEMIRSVKRGLYAPHFGGGQVDITSGKFVFSASEAYLIEDGKITQPVKGATLIGNGPEVMRNIKMIGNDLELDSGIGTCGKAGQSVPVGVGQPSLLVEPMTVGGTEIS